MFISNFPEKYVGKPFEIDCVDIEIHHFEDHQSTIFKGPGVIYGDVSGHLSYKVYNQIKLNSEIFSFLKQIKESGNAKKINTRLFAEDYDGIKWDGAWSIPTVIFPQTSYLLIRGEFDQLSTRVKKVVGDQAKNSTELIFAGHFDLPFSGIVNVKRFHGDKVISTSIWEDHHDIIFGDSSISFQESANKERTHVKVSHSDQFAAPYVENWLTEALIFITARMFYPRMVIRHFEKDALILIRATPQNTTSGMPPPFSREPQVRECIWDVFRSYLSKCKECQQFDFLEITKGFSELILASQGTIQGFLISLSLYIENCINQIFPSSKEQEYQEQVKELLKYVNCWEGKECIKKRAKAILSMLNTPSLTKKMDTLIREGVISEGHKEVWQKARPYLAHGNLVDFTKSDEFWHFRNFLISMAYRCTFRFLGYKGLVLDYDGSKFKFSSFKWDNRKPKKE